MDRLCELWAELHPQGGRGHEDSHVYLQFRRSNLLVRLNGADSDGDGRLDQVILRDTDALGLGLQDEDFAEGVAICRDDSADGALGWHCDPVRLVVLAADGTPTGPSDWSTAASG